MRPAIFAFSHADIDHIAPMAYILDIPVVLSDKKMRTICQTYYPQIKTQYIDSSDFSFDKIAARYDVLIYSYKPWAARLHLVIDTALKKKLMMVYCPHGNSDKIFTYTKTDLVSYHNHQFVYGQQMRDYIQEHSACRTHFSLQTTGNYRAQIYQKYKDHFDQLAKEKVLSRFEKKQRTVIYAPTWKDPDNNTSFFTQFATILEACPPHINLLIKLHPNLEIQAPAKTHYLLQNSEKHPNIIVNHDFTCMYPLLSACDAYLGDYSSVGYDFLYFRRPMFFFKKKDSPTPLHACGRIIPIEQEANPFLFIESHMDDACRNAQDALYSHAFDDSYDFKTIRNDFFRYIEDHGSGRADLRELTSPS